MKKNRLKLPAPMVLLIYFILLNITVFLIFHAWYTQRLQLVLPLEETVIKIKQTAVCHDCSHRSS